jgi:hypothetical protein
VTNSSLSSLYARPLPPLSPPSLSPPALPINIVPKVRITHLPIYDRLRDLRQNHLNTIIKVQGVITRRSTVFPKILEKAYNCLDCNTLHGPYPCTDADQNPLPPVCETCREAKNFKTNMSKWYLLRLRLPLPLSLPLPLPLPLPLSLLFSFRFPRFLLPTATVCMHRHIGRHPSVAHANTIRLTPHASPLLLCTFCSFST